MSDLIKREDAIHILACEMYAEAQSEGYDAESVEDYIPEATAWMSDAPSVEVVLQTPQTYGKSINPTTEIMSDLISREDAREAIEKLMDIHFDRQVVLAKARDAIVSLPSAEPKTEMVLCALADRACPFQGKEYAWCLTCPHISEEDRTLVKKAVAEPKTRWIPVSERLPEDDEIVLTTDNKGIVCPMCHASLGYNRKCWFTAEEGITYREDEIIAWMPLPEPYKGGENHE